MGGVCMLYAQSKMPEDSLRLQRVLKGEGEIRLNPQALKELERNFGTPQASEDKSWLKFDETLPKVPGVVKKKVKLTLRPYTGYTPYNWDPIHERKIDIDKPTWQENILRGIERMAEGVPAPSGMDFMQIFTKEFWNRKIKKRRARTVEALESYGDSISVHYKEKTRKE